MLTDVQVFGEYPYHMKAKMKKEGITIHMEKDDEEILKNNTVDFVAFSYYASKVVTTDHRLKINNYGKLQNPYCDASQWGLSLIHIFFLKDLTSKNLLNRNNRCKYSDLWMRNH